MKTIIQSALIMLFLAPVMAHAHGKALEIAGTADVVASCGGKSIIAHNIGVAQGKVRWMRTETSDGTVVAYVGLDRVKTSHGYFVQATCISPTSGAITRVILMRAMPDEAPALRNVTTQPEWWKKRPPTNSSAHVAALYRSVASLLLEFGKSSTGSK